MDPLSCLSVAGTTVQFIDFFFKILSESKELYESGKLSAHVQARELVEDLSNYSARMQHSLSPEAVPTVSTENDLRLQEICRECTVIADDLSARLAKFATSDQRKIWKSMAQGLRSMWAKKELEGLERKLSKYRDMMNSRLLGALWEKVMALHTDVHGQTAMVNSRTEELMANTLLEMHQGLSKEFKTQARLLEDVVLVHANTPNHPSNCPGATNEITEAQLRERIRDVEARVSKQASEDILASLRYEIFRERFEALTDAHRQTLGWIFKSPCVDHSVQWSDFVHWLREGDGIYWIHGKAGSGKSTLMKYIIEHERTNEHLLFWANGTPLHQGAFFFWWAGTRIQKSQEGFLRSLLHDVLVNVPELIPIVLPSQYADRYGENLTLTNSSRLKHVESWSLPVLSQAFHTLLFQSEIPIKLCLFIDGLDEYHGLEADIAKVFKDVSLSPHIKIYLSSRPHVPFEDAFATLPKLKLDSLTHSDIKLYVTERLENNAMMRKLAEKQPQECQSLAWEIAHAAQGVFVWVILVTNSLIRGLSNHDQVATLQRRLRTYPKDLDQLYLQMVTRVDEFYAEEASDIFQLVEAATEKHRADVTDVKPNNLTLLGLHLAMRKDLDLTRELKEMSFSSSIVEEEGREVDVLVKSRCGGLIETEYQGPDGPEFSPFMRVSYMHRTVRDFLVGEETRKILLARTGGEGTFKPNVAIFKSIVLQMKGYSPIKTLDDPFGRQALLYARRIDDDMGTPIEEVVHLFDELFKLVGWTELSHIKEDYDLERYVRFKLGNVSGSQRSGKSCCVQ